jgi:hypothetical protein
MSVTLLARKSRLSEAHVSNFIRAKRHTSSLSLGRLVAALGFRVELVPRETAWTRSTLRVQKRTPRLAGSASRLTSE